MYGAGFYVTPSEAGAKFYGSNVVELRIQSQRVLTMTATEAGQRLSDMRRQWMRLAIRDEAFGDLGFEPWVSDQWKKSGFDVVRVTQADGNIDHILVVNRQVVTVVGQ